MPVDIPNGLYYYYRGYWWLFLLKRLGTGLRKNYLVVWDRGEIFSVNPVRGGKLAQNSFLFLHVFFGGRVLGRIQDSVKGGSSEGS